MPTLMNVINYILPFFAFVLIVFGIMKSKMRFVLVALIVAIFAIVIQYEHAGGELFGRYFDYTHAAIYTVNFIVVISALLYILSGEKVLKAKSLRYPAAVVIAILVVASCIIVMNVWINAFFIKDRLLNTDVIEVGYFEKPLYCNNSVVYYKLNTKYQIEYLCPNYYLLIAKRGYLETTPKLLKEQLLKSVKLQSVPNKESVNILE